MNRVKHGRTYLDPAGKFVTQSQGYHSHRDSGGSCPLKLGKKGQTCVFTPADILDALWSCFLCPSCVRDHSLLTRGHPLSQGALLCWPEGILKKLEAVAVGGIFGWGSKHFDSFPPVARALPHFYDAVFTNIGAFFKLYQCSPQFTFISNGVNADGWPYDDGGPCLTDGNPF